ncbi:YgaP family membrane protein [Thiorhodovibrio frisius]|uniref:Inner membrane protein YgaP-like transmembrane domain-containing protein n=1 Tax=Thiorhodovibrio frisius TaxID=631362 RepID=H8Z3R7_9GAMM|nr:DUF2892 domain-containing protein [Thiorhodovibrio frisius]EIC20056.1 Protein of unknown function (DUF2892) [Thiorhodovibrio frisius]WPL20784.1 hypothetical protein Thiofri_00888 [Thiorhodovibrio frisius]
MDLPKNVGDQDRNIRFAVGGLLVLAGLFTVNAIVTVLGFIVVGTGYMRTCLAYVPLNINTMKKGDGKTESK